MELGLSFQPGAVESGYLSWPLLPEPFPKSFPGVKTSRDDLVVDIDKERLTSRMEQYFDPELSDSEVHALMPSAMTDAARFNARETRRYLVQRGFKPEKIVRYCYRPLDNRWLCWEPETKLLDEKRSEYFHHVFEGNVWLSAGQRNRKDAFYQPQVTTLLADHHLVESNVGMFPLYLQPAKSNEGLFTEGPRPNLTRNASEWLARQASEAADLLFHCVAITHASRYRRGNAGALRQDWPRIPLPNSREALAQSAELGKPLAGLLDPDTPVESVTAGKPRAELGTVAVVSREGGGALDPDAGDLDVTAGWGHRGKGGAVMPAKGRVIERGYNPEERAALLAGTAQLGLSERQTFELVGERTFDVYLNDRAYWRNIPVRVWEYTIGGYQVIKKWLSYREREILGRGLTMGEARDATGIARRIAAILLLGPELDANYAAIKSAAFAWPRPKGANTPDVPE